MQHYHLYILCWNLLHTHPRNTNTPFFFYFCEVLFDWMRTAFIKWSGLGLGKKSELHNNKQPITELPTATSATPFKDLFFAFQWRQTAAVLILFIQYSSCLLQHSAPSLWPVWWFVAHLKPQSCDLLVGVTTNPQHGWPSLPLSTHTLTHPHARHRKKHLHRTNIHVHTKQLDLLY